MSSAVKLAIIGFGKMGQRHWQKLRDDDRFEVVAIVDRNPPKESLPEGVLFSCDYREVSKDMAEAVLIASPSSLHAEMGLYFLAKGLHVFMEKPLALSFSDCRDLVSASLKAETVLMVGMVERFNPAFVACRDLLVDLDIAVQRLNFRRFNPTSEISDSDVILDLLIHDLDILLLLVGDLAVIDIEVIDFRFGQYGYDFVDIILRFAGGVESHLCVGRGADCGQAMRLCCGEWEGGRFELDFMARDLVNFQHCGKVYEGVMGGDALVGEHRAFFDFVSKGDKSLNELGTMELLFKIRQKLDSSRLNKPNDEAVADTKIL